MAEETITLRAYLTMCAVLMGGDDAPLGLVGEAVSSTLLSHPEWNPDERRTLSQWREGRPM